ncbi:phytanoyl-CoA dioxygenase family protein [Desertivirga xinjiangensis]|uniref:phytanoyl-CoA dioxygenase family protein n=1 Tax=Desertivirga xinjiangensis TaxID=539206 RepID=UPI00210BA6BF|nr:phytanoyl-CoA dioxygenase family protein [Pedobacter xinjiangensis]
METVYGTAQSVEELKIQGFSLQENWFDSQEMAALETALNAAKAFDYSSGHDPGNLLKTSGYVAELASLNKLTNLIPNFTTAGMMPVKAILLDKTKAFNWMIPWHQDLKISLKNKVESAGYTNWSIEAGIHHVEPPLFLLENLTTIRIHLDDCDEQNGAMMVIPGSHSIGRLSQDEIDSLTTDKAASGYTSCTIDRGGIMVFKPLLLHYSPLSQVMRPRRILQLEFAPKDMLAKGLEWCI